MNVERRPDDIEQARDDVHLDVQVVERANERCDAVVRVVREGDDHALDLERPNHVTKLVGRAEQRQLFEAGAPLLGLRVDEPDDIDAVLGMLEEFPRDGLTDLACPDDERVLHVHRVPAGDPAGADPRQRDERHR